MGTSFTLPLLGNELGQSNARGTLALSKVNFGGTGITTAKQWFFNTQDNSTPLDTGKGGYTVIGTVANSTSLAMMDQVAAALSSGTSVVVNSVTQLSIPPFFSGNARIPNTDFYYLAFANGTPFGYYITNFFPILYHCDMGFLAVTDANDGKGGINLFDFTSGTYFYTSPTLFPYLYDYTQGAWLYYYPDTTKPGHYTTNPRYFYNFGAGKIITK